MRIIGPPDYALFDAIDDRPRVDYGRWLLTLVCWDGLLPAIVFTAPFVVKLLLPNVPGAIEVLGVGLPITAFWIRVSVGFRHIGANHCGPLLRGAQRIVLGLAAFCFVLVDCFVIVLQFFMPPQANGINDEALLVFAVIGGTYLSLMAFALYPGRAKFPSANRAE